MSLRELIHERIHRISELPNTLFYAKDIFTKEEWLSYSIVDKRRIGILFREIISDRKDIKTITYKTKKYNSPKYCYIRII